MVGEIGGNDYNYAFLQYLDEARDTLRILELVPLVVAKIKHAVEVSFCRPLLFLLALLLL